MKCLKSQEMRKLAPELDPLRIGTGWKPEELAMPQVIIESTAGDSHPGSGHLHIIVDEVKKQTGVDAVYIEKLEDIAPWLKENIQAGDLIITMGAGNIYTVGENLAQSL